MAHPTATRQRPLHSLMSRPHILSRRVRTILGKPRLARLCTIDTEGFPHAVPIYFIRLGDHILFGTDPGAAIRGSTNPKALDSSRSTI